MTLLQASLRSRVYISETKQDMMPIVPSRELTSLILLSHVCSHIDDLHTPYSTASFQITPSDLGKYSIRASISRGLSVRAELFVPYSLVVIQTQQHRLQTITNTSPSVVGAR